MPHYCPQLFTCLVFLLSLLISHVGQAVDIHLHFKMDWEMADDEMFTVTMPRFTDGRAVSLIDGSLSTADFNLQLQPSRLFSAAWIEGNYDNNDNPFNSSFLAIQKKRNVYVPNGVVLDIIIYAENGLRAYCGFPAYDAQYDVESTRHMEQFILSSNTSQREGRNLNNGNVTVIFDHPQMGLGCQTFGDCNGRGTCDFCKEQCVCDEGWGGPGDIIMTGSAMTRHCFHRVCPAGKAIGDLPTGPTTAHALAECSNMGICDRSTGECECFPPFTGRACERLGCPNDCSGHGQCLSMREIAAKDYAMPLIRDEASYGYDTTSVAWDADIMHACVCDSSWEVGINRGQTQLPEYFGPDCSMRRCPSGDNPHSTIDETDCEGLNQSPYGVGVGSRKNLCHVDCSGRGLCDHSTGRCKCFEGSTGYNCADLPTPYRRPVDPTTD